ncbi:MAG: magnesium chelatase ATPase subunit D, partial [Pseudomonadota bacterium]
MNARAASTQEPSQDSPGLVLDLLAIAPSMLGGIALRGLPGPGRDAVLNRLSAVMDPPVRVPVNVSEERLLGGLDIASTLRARRPVYERGLLEMAHKRLLVLSMAERLESHFVGLICQAMDAQQLIVERDGRSGRTDCSPVVVALDESLEDDEHLAPALADRLAFSLATDDLGRASPGDSVVTPDTLADVRQRFA